MSIDPPFGSDALKKFPKLCMIAYKVSLSLNASEKQEKQT
jgi:hypothetical protein